MRNENSRRRYSILAALLLALVCGSGPAAAIPAASQKNPAPSNKDVVSTAIAAGQFKTLVAALQAAGLVETLKGAGPFTVFAPTDAAFAKLPAGNGREPVEAGEQGQAQRDPHVSRGAGPGAGRAGRRHELGPDRQWSAARHPHRRRGGHGRRSSCGERRHPLQQRRDPRDRHGAAPQLIRRAAGRAPPSPTAGPLFFSRLTSRFAGVRVPSSISGGGRPPNPPRRSMVRSDRRFEGERG